MARLVSEGCSGPSARRRPYFNSLAICFSRSSVGAVNTPTVIATAEVLAYLAGLPAGMFDLPQGAAPPRRQAAE